MSQTSSHVDPRLTTLVGAVKGEEPGLQVISARIYTVPYADVHIIIEVLADRQFNILEEFILRAAYELQPRPTLDALAAMLGLDPLFVEASWQKLDAMQAVVLEQGQVIGLTDRGRAYYLQGQLPPASLEEELDLRYWFVTDALVPAGPIPRSPAPAPMLPGCDSEDEDVRMATLARVMTDVDRIISVTVAAGLGLHQPEEGQRIHAVRNWRALATGVEPVAVLAVQDTVTTAGQGDGVVLRALDPASGRRDFGIETALQRWMAAGTVTLCDFVPEDADRVSASSEDEVGELLAETSLTAAKVGEREVSTLDQGESEPPVSPARTVEAVPDDAALLPRLKQALPEAQYTVLMGFPQHVAETIDDTLAELLDIPVEHSVITVIGVGRADTSDENAFAQTTALAERLHGHITLQPYPVTVVIPVEDQHSVEVVIDGRLHIFGPAQALPGDGGYRSGDQASFGEEEAEPAEAGAGALQARFADAAAKHWANAVGAALDSEAGALPETLNLDLARYCVVWVAIGRYEIALRRILELVDAVPRVLPDAFRLMTVTLLALQRLPDDRLAESVDIERLREAVIDIDTRFADIPEELYVDAQDHLAETWHTLRQRLEGY